MAGVQFGGGGGVHGGEGLQFVERGSVHDIEGSAQIACPLIIPTCAIPVGHPETFTGGWQFAGVAVPPKVAIGPAPARLEQVFIPVNELHSAVKVS